MTVAVIALALACTAAVGAAAMMVAVAMRKAEAAAELRAELAEERAAHAETQRQATANAKDAAAWQQRYKRYAESLEARVEEWKQRAVEVTTPSAAAEFLAEIGRAVAPRKEFRE